jgi:hypothetical protein
MIAANLTEALHPGTAREHENSEKDQGEIAHASIYA